MTPASSQPPASVRTPRSEKRDHAQTIGAILALGVVRWHQRRARRGVTRVVVDEPASAVGPETGHMAGSRDSSDGQEANRP